MSSGQDAGSNGLAALGVLLKCNSSRNQHQLAWKELCALLCCSSEAASMVHAAYRGKMKLTMPNPLGEAGPRWLAANASLLSSVRVALALPSPSGDEAAVAAALKEAAAAASGGLLPLQELVCHTPLTTGELLTSACASSSTLTSLTLALSRTPKAVAGQLSSAVASLSSLQTLRLAPANPMRAEAPAHTSQLGTALSSLSNLTELVLSGAVLLDPKQAKHLPVSLQRLAIDRRVGAGGGLGPVEKLQDPEIPAHLALEECIELQSLDLSHLTSLSDLTLFQLLPRDKLPASLTELRLFAPCTFSPALTLPQLQTLSISDSAFNGRADWGVLNHLNKLSALQSVAIHIDDPFGTSYCGGEFAPWTNATLKSYAPVLMGIRQLKSLQLTNFFLLPEVINSLSSATGLTALALRRCYVALGDHDLTWGSLGWPKNQLVRHLRGFAASLRRMTALQHLDLELELDDSGWRGEEDDTEPSASEEGQGVLTSVDLQPIVDTIVSLRSVESLRVRLVPTEWAKCKAPLLSAAQEAALAAVAPKPESPYLLIA